MDKCFAIGMRLKPVEATEKYDLASAMEHTMTLSSDDNSNSDCTAAKSTIIQNLPHSDIWNQLLQPNDEDTTSVDYLDQSNNVNRTRRRSSIKTSNPAANNTQYNFDLNQFELEQVEEIKRAMAVFEDESTLPIVGVEKGNVDVDG